MTTSCYIKASCSLNWDPDSLFNLALSAVAKCFNKYLKEIKELPAEVLFDLFYMLYSKGRLCQLSFQLMDLQVFDRILQVKSKRCRLHHCFQALADHGTSLPESVADIYKQTSHTNFCTPNDRDRHISLGFSLGSFFFDAGWYCESELCFKSIYDLTCNEKPENLFRKIDVAERIIHCQICDYRYDEAKSTMDLIQTLLKQTENENLSINKALVYIRFAAYYLAVSNYNEAYAWSLKSFEELTKLPHILSISIRTIIDVLRLSSRVFTVRRLFSQADVLCKQACLLARKHFGTKSLKYVDCIKDYGFYLLYVDSIDESVQAFQLALDICLQIFGGNNILVAIAHCDLAYALYVQEYSNGRFDNARKHAEQSIEILQRQTKQKYLLLASCKRVKALIVEEIAIDSRDPSVKNQLLNEAHELHQFSLKLSLDIFGEENINTAKHYGNLGRLYQSMNKYDDAREMHLRAIRIKERILGEDDYEVALSIGHLASLYNYDMKKYDEAERLYYRSIDISRRLFGDSYSGLEYDYRGLVRLYLVQGYWSQLDQLQQTFLNYQMLRSTEKPLENILQLDKEPMTTENLFDYVRLTINSNT
ncbi:unnamed protein product [Didymodactylos carnosus]|uniref:Amyloid protein-binding protein 2 n=1 Tax=Didymodactylos carnosus TaxID=1234261 RepID=A0A8S2DL96_9BILA|nr:unnamed protein product [Didymodactylos carnosus]CAF3701438.1 unnamed protein product [Didymodactylos carnosus]